MSDSIIPSATFGLINTDDASAQASHILNPYTAYARGTKLTGSMTNHGNVGANLNAGEAYTIPAGYHAGGGVIRANSLAAQTNASATASDIISGKTAWVNGSFITGNFTSPGVDFQKLLLVNFTTRASFSLSSLPFYETIDIYVFARNSLKNAFTFYTGDGLISEFVRARVTGLFTNELPSLTVPAEYIGQFPNGWTSLILEKSGTSSSYSVAASTGPGSLINLNTGGDYRVLILIFSV